MYVPFGVRQVLKGIFQDTLMNRVTFRITARESYFIVGVLKA